MGVASEEMKDRMFEVCLADLNNDEDQSFRKMKLIAEEVQGDKVLCNFQGMDFTRDKLCSLIKKWQTLIEASADVRTTDGYYLRIFTIGFTKKRQNQIKKSCSPRAPNARPSATRWLTSSPKKHPSVNLRSSSRSSSPKSSARKSRRLAMVSTLCRTCLSGRSRC